MESTLLRARVWIVVASVAVGWAGLTHGAVAQDARELFRRGEAAYAVGNYEGAIREWGAAYAADPRPRIQYNLSQAYERLGRLPEAIEALERYVNSADPDDPQYSDANARLAALQQRLALTGVRIVGGAEGGRILVDGTEWGRTPRPDKIHVRPGPHRIEVQWAGRPSYVANIVVPAGQTMEVTIEGGVTPDTTDTTDTTVPIVDDQQGDDWEGGGPADAPSGGGPSIPVLIAGAGLAGVGVAFLGYGIERATYLSGGMCSRPFTCPGEDDVARQRNAGLAVGVVGIAGGAALVVLSLTVFRNEPEPVTGTALRCAPGLASASCTLRF